MAAAPGISRVGLAWLVERRRNADEATAVVGRLVGCDGEHNDPTSKRHRGQPAAVTASKRAPESATIVPPSAGPVIGEIDEIVGSTRALKLTPLLE